MHADDTNFIAHYNQEMLRCRSKNVLNIYNQIYKSHCEDFQVRRLSLKQQKLTCQLSRIIGINTSYRGM